MTERPILFSGEMVRAILEGRKTQTRRIIKGEVEHWDDVGLYIAENPCPYGQPGDRLWVRESWAPAADNWGAFERWMVEDRKGPKPTIHYRADGGDPFIEQWRPSIHMPRWASRITLEVTDVRVARLQNISAMDCAAEGIDIRHFNDADEESAFARADYRALWEKINGAGAWDKNPWVWVIEFKRLAELESRESQS